MRNGGDTERANKAGVVKYPGMICSKCADGSIVKYHVPGIIGLPGGGREIMLGRVNDSAKPDIAIIGPGRVGISVGTAARAAGYRIRAVAGGTGEEKARAAAARLDAPYVNIEAAAEGCALLLLAVPDDEIAGICDDLAGSGALAGRPAVNHFSGALGSDILKPAAEKDCPVASMHPLQSFPDGVVTDVRGTWWFIEGDAGAAEAARQLCADTGGQSRTIHTSDKPLYHAASVFCSNYLVAMIDAGIELYRAAGIADDDARDAVGPLVRAVVANALQSGAAAALTGPVERGDAATVRSHVDAVAAVSGELLDLYRAAGKHTVRLAEKKGAIEQDISDALLSVFNNEE